MKEMITCYEKNIESTNESIKNTEATLRNLTENQESLNTGKILKTNVETIKRQLQQRKFKKFNYLKYKPQPKKEQTPAITQANFKKSLRKKYPNTEFFLIRIFPYFGLNIAL